MPVINETRSENLAENTKICDDIVSKGLGLMFRKKLDNKAFVFNFKKEKLVPLHMLFVFQAIDVLFLDKDKKVVEIKLSLRPFSFYNPKNKAQYVIELSENTAKNCSPGDSISF